MSSSLFSVDNKDEPTPIGVSIVEVDPSLSSRDGPPPNPSFMADEQWQPGFRKRFPWVGFGCLLMVVVFSVVAIVVLTKSNDRPLSTWPHKMAPNVILSVCNSGASVCIAIAVAQGIAVSWWRRAMKGATIADLHNTWAFGSSIASVVLNVKYFNIAALAAIVTKLTIIDGILFQRSTGTYIQLGPPGKVNLTTYPTSQLPDTAKLNDAGNDTGILLLDFTIDVMSWTSSAYSQPYQPYGFTECQGICDLTVLAPGYIATCEKEHAQMRQVDPIGDAAAHVGRNKTHINAETTLFSVSFNTTFPTAAKNYTWIGLNFTYYDAVDPDASDQTQKCPMMIHTKQCELREAMLKYPIHVEYATTQTNATDSHTIVSFGTSDPTTGSVVFLADDFDYEKGQIPGFDFQWWIANATAWRPTSRGYTITGGIARALSDRYKSATTLRTTSNNTKSDWYLSTTGEFSGVDEFNPDDSDQCPYTFPDPMTRLVNGLNTLTFLTANDLYNRPGWLDSGPDVTWEIWSNSSAVLVEGSQRRAEEYYKTKYGWMFGALASTLVCVLLVLPSYWGFWELGRKVTLNPIEVANAFQAPAFAPAHPRSGLADDIVKVAGERVVRYTVAEASERGRNYRIVPL